MPRPYHLRGETHRRTATCLSHIFCMLRSFSHQVSYSVQTPYNVGDVVQTDEDVRSIGEQVLGASYAPYDSNMLDGLMSPARKHGRFVDSKIARQQEVSVEV